MHSPIKDRADATVYIHINGKNVGVCQGISTSFSSPLPLCKAENITVIIRLKTGEENVTDRE